MKKEIMSDEILNDILNNLPKTTPTFEGKVPTLKLVSSDDPILKEALPRFDFSNPPEDPVMLARELAEMMIYHRGLGLAANQVGWRHRLCVISANPIICLFNPLIVDVSEEGNVLEEGCLSFPNMLIKIKRPNVIRVRYTQPNGETLTRKFQGMTARVIHHEVDHLDGITFQQRASKVHLAMAKGKKKAKI